MSIELLNIDCMRYMEGCDDDAFDLAIVDPPYGIGIGKNETGSIIKNKSQSPKFTAKNWDDERPGMDFFNELFRVSKEQIIWGGNYFGDELGYCKAPFIWDKLNGASLYADGEMAWTSRGLPKNLKIWRHQWCGCFKDSERERERVHPTQKPIALYKWLLENYATPEFKILDTHLGAGAIAVASHYFGNSLVGCEIDEEYYKTATTWIDKKTRQMELL
jgi:site-specific DNA-methyltransferase (adenine-specific)